MRRSAAVLAALLLAGCAKKASPEADAQETVKRFFAALPARDCAVLNGMLVVGPGDDDCAKMVDELARRMRLMEVLGAEVDGRDPDAVMVRARVERDGQQRELLLRVVRTPDGWKLKL